jgi:hypothetical protein
MHVRLSQVLDREVMGEVTRVGESFFDVGLGRVCLDRLTAPEVERLVGRLRSVFGDGIKVEDRLHLEQPREVIRGLAEVTIHDPETDSPYLLQITAKPILALLERRFMLGPDEPADLMGVLCEGLHVHMESPAERPLRLLSNYEELHGLYLEHLDAALRAAIDGTRFDCARAVEELGDGVRRAWRLLPANLKAQVNPLSRPAKDRICEHDRSFQRTIIFAVNVMKGSLDYTYSHRQNPLEVYEQVLAWMAEIPLALHLTFKPPTHALLVGRGSSVQEFLERFPGLQGVVGPTFEEEVVHE